MTVSTEDIKKISAFDRMLNDDVLAAAGRGMYDARPIELDQSGGDDWDVLPEDWREEWIDGARAAVEAALAAAFMGADDPSPADVSPDQTHHQEGRS